MTLREIVLKTVSTKSSASFLVKFLSLDTVSTNSLLFITTSKNLIPRKYNIKKCRFQAILEAIFTFLNITIIYHFYGLISRFFINPYKTIAITLLFFLFTIFVQISCILIL